MSNTNETTNGWGFDHTVVGVTPCSGEIDELEVKKIAFEK